jgi:queuine/archaeosine tRNA-ribosyltransferase
MDNPGEQVLNSYKKYLEEKHVENNALHELLNFRDYPLLINIRDPEYPHQTSQANEKFMFGDTEGGRKKVDPNTYYRLIDAFNPEIFMAMHDATIEDAVSASHEVPKKISKKMQKSFDRSKKWIQGVQQKNMIGPLVGGQFVDLRKNFIQYLNHASGIHFGDLGALVPQQRYQILDKCLEHVKSANSGSLVRFVSGQDHPCNVLFMIANF